MSVRLTRRPTGAGLGGLLTRVARGDQAAFTEVYHRTVVKVHGLVAFMLDGSAAAGDVTATVYQQLWHTVAAYRPACGSADAWLLALAHRRAAAYLRAHRYPAQRPPRPPAPLPPWLERLDPPSRDLILLVYYRGYTAEQAAALLGLPPGTALRRLHAALSHPAAAPATTDSACEN